MCTRSLIAVPSAIRPLKGDKTIYEKKRVFVIDDAQYELRPNGVAFHRCAAARSQRLVGEEHGTRWLQERRREHPVHDALAQREQPLVSCREPNLRRE
ncbi:MAG: hypothetical protein IPG76_04060 [Acidobacteria bacterium]|nr:hypothetical protein [Acidobacteriota bacterium]